jgi:hypothetical protein
MLALEKLENLTGYRLIRIHFILFCVCIFQQKRYSSTGQTILELKDLE